MRDEVNKDEPASNALEVAAVADAENPFVESEW